MYLQCNMGYFIFFANNINNIQQALDKIPSTHRPKEIICVKNIEHTSNGKIRRTKLL